MFNGLFEVFSKVTINTNRKKIIGYYRQHFESNRENLCRGSIGINEQKFVLDLIIIDFDKYFLPFNEVQCFLDDILIGVETLDELKKKLFTKTKEVSVEGIRLCQDKVKAIIQLSAPQNVNQLK